MCVCVQYHVPKECVFLTLSSRKHVSLKAGRVTGLIDYGLIAFLFQNAFILKTPSFHTSNTQHSRRVFPVCSLAGRAGGERPRVLAVQYSIMDGGEDHVQGHRGTEELQSPEIRQQSSCPTSHTRSVHSVVLLIYYYLHYICTYGYIQQAQFSHLWLQTP